MKCYYKDKSIDELKDIVNESNTLAEVMRKLGYTGNRGNSIKGLKQFFTENNIDISKFSINNRHCYSHPSCKLEDIMVSESTYTNMNRFKERLLQSGLIKNECYCCGLTCWNGKPITLQLDHINGNNRDNRLENLRLLCPNCHSQTSTYCGRKKKK